MEVETERLVLVPIGPEHAEDLYRLHQDPWIAAWYAGAWSHEEAVAFAASCAEGWTHDGVGKWMAYERTTGGLMGRGGLSRMSLQASSTRQIDTLLDDPQWRAVPLEVGWAVSGAHRKLGVATELGRAALSFAAGELEARRVVAFAERHNFASRRVMEKLELRLAGEIRTRGLVEDEDAERDDAPFVVYATPKT